MTPTTFASLATAVASVTRQLDRIENGAIDPELASTLDELIAKSPEEALLLVWLAVRKKPSGFKWRMVAFLVAKFVTSRGPGAAWLPLLDLATKPFPTDDSTRLNCLTAFRGFLIQDQDLPSVFALDFSSFLVTCLESNAELVVGGALDLLTALAEARRLPEYVAAEDPSKLRAALNALATSPIPQSVGVSVAELLSQIPDKPSRRRWQCDAERDAVAAAKSRWDKLPGSAARSALLEAGELVDEKFAVADAVSESRRLGQSIERVHIAMARDKQPSLSIVTQVLNLWKELLDATQLYPMSASPGSFTIRLTVDTDQDLPNAFERIRELVAQADAAAIGRAVETGLSGDKYRDLIELLVTAGVELRVTLASPEVDAIAKTVLITPASAQLLLEPARQWASTHLASGQVPQADDLMRLFGMIDLIQAGRTIDSDTLEITPRQVAYYKHAARVLGLVTGESVLTSAGQQFARLAGDERMASMTVHFESSACGSTWVAWARAKSLGTVDPDSAEAFLSEASELKGQTVGRRAKTLRTWLTALLPFHFANYRPGKPQSSA